MSSASGMTRTVTASSTVVSQDVDTPQSNFSDPGTPLSESSSAFSPRPMPHVRDSIASEIAGVTKSTTGTMTIFVPGRVCLFGEHSDWAGGYRRFNPDIPVGMTIVCGINQGIYATVSKHPTSLVIKATTSDGQVHGPVTIPMRKQDLLDAARAGGFFSYACGVAYRILKDYQVAGLVIDNYMTDLPTKKGLSSSAAICVLVARAFSAVYDLKLTARGEMELAYQGEILTPSRCGRMDQCCAYGPRPILMRYDGDFLDVDELEIQGGPFNYVIVDLRGTKSTMKILSSLQEGYPTPATDIHHGVHNLLGEVNIGIASRAVAALKSGDQETLGRLMREAQAEFDRYAQPACPSELTMPLLHKVLRYDKIQSLIFGGKGVGSQGDGTLQLLCKSAEAQDQVCDILQTDFGMPCIKFSLSAGPQIKTAVIPAAGFSSKNFPASRPIQAELFPIMDGDGLLKPIIVVNVESLVRAGIQKVVIIVRPDDLPSFERLFKVPLRSDHFNKLSAEDQQYAKHLLALGERVEFVVQERQDGFGHAIYVTRTAVNNEPFLLMLGDHLYSSTSTDGASCVKQMLDAYKRHRTNIIGLKRTPKDSISRFGVATGVFHRNEPRDDGRGSDGEQRLIDVTHLREKPTVEYAEEHLRVPGLPDDEYLTMFGQYVISPKVFEYLHAAYEENARTASGDFQFTPALERLAQDEGLIGLLVRGHRFDIGSPESYMHALSSFKGDVVTPTLRS